MRVVMIDKKGNLSSETYTTYGSLQYTWKTKKYEIQLYGKTDGNAGNENKYDFPPPVDNVLFFDKCMLVNPNGDITIEQWNDFYESIMQFEDIAETESESEEEEVEGEYTNGYLKDGFVVSDSELD